MHRVVGGWHPPSAENWWRDRVARRCLRCTACIQNQASDRPLWERAPNTKTSTSYSTVVTHMQRGRLRLSAVDPKMHPHSGRRFWKESTGHGAVLKGPVGTTDRCAPAQSVPLQKAIIALGSMPAFPSAACTAPTPSSSLVIIAPFGTLLLVRSGGHSHCPSLSVLTATL
jgi:hypothetical protein